jgi:alcohol dehydrogenase class IV
MEELSEIVHRGRKHHLIVWTGRQIKDWYLDELTDYLGINSDDVSVNSGLQYHPTLIILSHIKVGIEEPD